jgi:hypothetical protein
MNQPALQVQAIDLGIRPHSGVPRPVLLQSESACYLLFEGSTKELPDAGVVAIVKFQSCRISRFGYPNDEALPGHPLYKFGLRHYDAFEVNNSPWEHEIRLQNRVMFPTFDMPKRRHFVITFHDSTFECIAATVEAEITNESISNAVARIAAALANDV